MIGERPLSFDIAKKFQDTQKNLVEAAKYCGLKDELLTVLKLKLPSDFKLPEEKQEDKPKPDAEDSGVKEHGVFKYNKDIPLAEQIKLNGKYVFLQIVDDKPITSESIDLSESQKIILHPIGMTPILDFEYESVDDDEINQIIEVVETKTLDELYKWSKSLWQKL